MTKSVYLQGMSEQNANICGAEKKAQEEKFFMKQTTRGPSSASYLHVNKGFKHAILSPCDPISMTWMDHL
jgi:hypothetical protein